MKLFKKYDVNRSQVGAFMRGTLLGFGRLLYTKNVETVTTFKGLPASAIDKVNVPEGRFVRIELPFKTTKTYTCPYSYEVVTGPVKATWLFTWRKPKDKTIFTKVFAWLPA